MDPTFSITAANARRQTFGCEVTKLCTKNVTVTVKAKNSIDPTVEVSLTFILKANDTLAYIEQEFTPQTLVIGKTFNYDLTSSFKNAYRTTITQINNKTAPEYPFLKAFDNKLMVAGGIQTQRSIFGCNPKDVCKKNYTMTLECKSALADDPGVTLSFDLIVDDQYALFPVAFRNSDLWIGQEYAFVIVITHADYFEIKLNGTNIETLSWINLDKNTNTVKV